MATTTSSFALTFSEAVQAGDGRFELLQGSTVLTTMSAQDAAKVVFGGQTVTLNGATLPPKPLKVVRAGMAWKYR